MWIGGFASKFDPAKKRQFQNNLVYFENLVVRVLSQRVIKDFVVKLSQLYICTSQGFLNRDFLDFVLLFRFRSRLRKFFRWGKV